MDKLDDELYIVIPKWERFQHYKDRDPVWIKVYTKLLRDPAYLRLSLASKGLLQVIWLAYASESLSLRVGDARRLVGASNGIGHQLISLRDAGFIDISASRLLATKKEEETEKEKERRRAGAREARDARPPARQTDDDYVLGLVANGVITEAFELDDWNISDELRQELRKALK